MKPAKIAHLQDWLKSTNKASNQSKTDVYKVKNKTKDD